LDNTSPEQFTHQISSHDDVSEARPYTQGKNLNMLSLNGYVILLIPIPSYLINNIIIFPLTQNQTRKKNCIFVQNYTPSFNSQYRIVSYKRTDLGDVELKKLH